MAEATPSLIEHWEGMARSDFLKEGGSPVRFALPWYGPVVGRDERPRSSAVGLGITGASKRIPNHDRVGTGFVSQDYS